jgi:hypothetical protein
MADDFRIERASDAGNLDIVAALFRGYAASLPVDLGYQGFDEERAAKPWAVSGCGRWATMCAR